MFEASYVVLWILTILALSLTILLYRQYGLTLLSGRQRINLRGLDVGAAPSTLELSDVDGQALLLDWHVEASGGRVRVAVFAEPACPICAGLLSDRVEMADVANRWPNVEFLWIDGHIPDPDRRPPGWIVASVEGGLALRQMQIPAYPFAYVISGSRIQSKGLVNHPEDIEALVQDALGSHPRLGRRFKNPQDSKDTAEVS